MKTFDDWARADPLDDIKAALYVAGNDPRSTGAEFEEPLRKAVRLIEHLRAELAKLLTVEAPDAD